MENERKKKRQHSDYVKENSNIHYIQIFNRVLRRFISNQLNTATVVIYIFPGKTRHRKIFIYESEISKKKIKWKSI